ncbi:MAG: hypothetical protein INH41_25790 [Myxococcaceae bacterium]|jgi:hypothetical protein|nr:hypothetical protein [Myxococcaceae bacterium]MCA3015814.1 hypothetical protein [Myxococcaceae bacterium]
MRRSRAGQTLVLGVLTMLLLALTTMAGFNLTHAVHERIRIQAAADAQAYSVAVMQARAFNTAAYANRTIAAILVAQTGLHAWLTIALNDVSMVHKGAAGMGLAALYELTMARCNPKKTPQHCIHAAEAGIIAARLRSKASQLEQKLWSNMSKFNDAAKALKEAHRATYRQTKTYAQQVKGALASGSAPLSSMLRASAPRASYQSDVDQANVSSFACTLEGTDFDGECRKVDKLVFDRGALGASQRAKFMVDAANAARPTYEAEGKTSVPTGIGKDLAHDDFIGERVGPQAKNPRAVRSLMGRGEVVFTWTGSGHFSSTVSDRNVSSQASSMFGPNVSSLTWRCAPHWFTAPGMGGAGGRVTDSGQASISGGGSRGANGFEGFACQGEDCFVNFRAMSGRDNDDGQPSTFGAVTQNLRDLQVSGRGTFELNANATSTVRVGSQQVKVQLAPRQNAVAVAKGKAYFHQLGASWSIRPNMFDPFWRAKLHPFRDGAELSAALSLAGARDPDVANDLPVEGKR